MDEVTLAHRKEARPLPFALLIGLMFVGFVFGAVTQLDNGVYLKPPREMHCRSIPKRRALCDRTQWMRRRYRRRGNPIWYVARYVARCVAAVCCNGVMQ